MPFEACLCVPRDPALPRAHSAPASNWTIASKPDPFSPLAPLLRCGVRYLDGLRISSRSVPCEPVNKVAPGSSDSGDPGNDLPDRARLTLMAIRKPNVTTTTQARS